VSADTIIARGRVFALQGLIFGLQRFARYAEADPQSAVYLAGGGALEIQLRREAGGDRRLILHVERLTR
jgi:hypothetical protein